MGSKQIRFVRNTTILYFFKGTKEVQRGVDELSDLETKGTIARNATEEILVKRGNYWNIEVFDVRWYVNDKPSRKGIRMNIEEAKLLLKILERELE